MGWKILLLHTAVVLLDLGAQGEEPTGQSGNSQPDVPDSKEEELCRLPPNMDGQWSSTFWGDVTISGSVIKMERKLGGTDARELECYRSSDSGDFVLRSRRPVSFFESPFFLLTCIMLKAKNENHYYVVVKTGRDAHLNNEPVTLQGMNNTYLERTCQGEPEKWLHGDMVRTGNISSAAEPCPAATTGKATVTFYSEPEMMLCPNDALMTSCGVEDKSLFLDCSGCNKSGLAVDTGDAFGSSSIWCLGENGNGVLLYERRENTSSFYCATFTHDSHKNNTIIVEQTPGGCRDTWDRELSPSEKHTMKASLANFGACDVPTDPPPAATLADNSTTNNTGSLGSLGKNCSGPGCDETFDFANGTAPSYNDTTTRNGPAFQGNGTAPTHNGTNILHVDGGNVTYPVDESNPRRNVSVVLPNNGTARGGVNEKPPCDCAGDTACGLVPHAVLVVITSVAVTVTALGVNSLYL